VNAMPDRKPVYTIVYLAATLRTPSKGRGARVYTVIYEVMN